MYPKCKSIDFSLIGGGTRLGAWLGFGKVFGLWKRGIALMNYVGDEPKVPFSGVVHLQDSLEEASDMAEKQGESRSPHT